MQIVKSPFKLCLTLLLSLIVTVAHGEKLALQNLPKIKSIALHDTASGQLHAATDQGLYASKDNGRSWSLSYPFRLPATLLTSASDGTLYAFVAGKGLLRIRGAEPMWTPVNNTFGAQVLIQLSASKKDPNRLVGLNQFGGIIVSDDAGADWHRVDYTRRPLSESAERGRKLFGEHCQSCHGVEGVGETYSVEALTDKQYIMAPALDDTAHAWHHTDDALVEMILNGSQRTERMKAWQQEGLTEYDARDLVNYMKSLWSERILACQGPKHMQCM